MGHDSPPVPFIRYQTRPPRDGSDYPYTAVAPPSQGPAPGAAVYLTADGSFDPEGLPVDFFWNAQDPDGRYLPIQPDPTARQASFSPERVGPHAVTLEVVETTGLRQIGHVTLTLIVAPRPCALDGVSPPCGDGLAVPGGTFVAGSDVAGGPGNERPAHPAAIAGFELDAYEVTVGRFRAYLAAYTGAPPPDGAGAHPLIPGSGWQPGWVMMLSASRSDFSFAISECGGTWTDEIGDSEGRPMTCVTWFAAFAFCAWQDKRLPTEAEWEYAAAGGDEQRRYPWGAEAPSVAHAVFGCSFDGLPGCADADLPTAGSLPKGAGRWGHLDLAGSVWEWTMDSYHPYPAALCDNCAPISADLLAGRVFRGGDYTSSDPSYLRATTRLGFTGGFPDQARGFRCARSLPAGNR